MLGLIFTRHAGAMMGLAAAAMFGASTPLAKLLLGQGTDPWMLAALLYSGSGLGLTLVSLLRTRNTGVLRLKNTDLGWLLLVVLTGGIAAPLLLMVGLSHTSAASASLLLNIEGLATMGIAWVYFRESVDRRLLLGALSILGGALLLAFRGTDGFGLGALAITAACIFWGIDNNLTRKLSGGDPVRIAGVKGVVAGGINFVLALAHGAGLPPVPQIVASLILGFFGYGISLVLFVLALRHLGAARTGAYFSTAPFIGAILAIGVLGDPFTVTLFVSALLMAFGVYLHITENHEHDHSHESMEHAHQHSPDLHHQHAHKPSDPPGETHTHNHVHHPVTHRHPHYPDVDHRHSHKER